jgi:hypothetical protein
VTGFCRVKDLQPGMRILASVPMGEAAVIRTVQTKTMTAMHGRAPRGGPEDEPAMIVDFEMISGVAKGEKYYTYQHPLDKVRIR